MLPNFPSLCSVFAVFLLFLTAQFPKKVLGMICGAKALKYQMLEDQSSDGSGDGSGGEDKSNKLDFVDKECRGAVGEDECRDKKVVLKCKNGGEIILQCTWNFLEKECKPSEEATEFLTIKTEKRAKKQTKKKAMAKRWFRRNSI
ncbi:hypothetical protein niasHT_022457 [Heterodera trifolii]|uniref:Uncharacterized protein n=1 Tax=Heterodera trifolii TaxID=157864 RepID=A0ABD2JGS7_9BILA